MNFKQRRVAISQLLAVAPFPLTIHQIACYINETTKAVGTSLGSQNLGYKCDVISNGGNIPCLFSVDTETKSLIYRVHPGGLAFDRSKLAAPIAPRSTEVHDRGVRVAAYIESMERPVSLAEITKNTGFTTSQVSCVFVSKYFPYSVTRITRKGSPLRIKLDKKENVDSKYEVSVTKTTERRFIKNTPKEQLFFNTLKSFYINTEQRCPAFM